MGNVTMTHVNHLNNKIDLLIDLINDMQVSIVNQGNDINIVQGRVEWCEVNLKNKLGLKQNEEKKGEQHKI